MIHSDYNLKSINTFGIAVNAKKFTDVKSVSELDEVVNSNKQDELLIIGGGSNILFTEDFDGLLVQNKITGISIQQEDTNTVTVKAGAGVVWHEFVIDMIYRGYGGIENLSLIPGSVGASPMQNIGAYGVEIKDVFVSLEAYNIADRTVHTFNKEECEFGYRESVFKRKLKNQFIITSVTYKLTKTHTIKKSYGAIEEQLELMKITEPSIKDISDAVIAIRSSKLPDPKTLGNAGSFFKNPVINTTDFEKIKINFPEIPNYPAPENNIKLAAGWLIEKAGWKGKQVKNCGVHKNQALVIVNYGGATGNEIFELSTNIIESVKQKFDITLEREVNIK